MKDEPLSVELTDLIRREIIESGGAIPFARFMELSLYAPGLGYYDRSRRPIGRHGDFYTSVSVGPVFGELLAFQFTRWLEELDPHSCQPLQLIEAGAHDGQLASDILGWLRQWRRKLFDRIELWLVEPSQVRRGWQEERLAGFTGRVRWANNLPELHRQTDGIRGILYANELLDAFPVHRFAWSASAARWQELGVTQAGPEFVSVRLPEPRSPAARSEVERLSSLPQPLLAVLPDGFTTEASPAAVAWWRDAAKALRAGWLMTLDYGLSEEEFLRPERQHGTIRAYRQHQPGNDLLAHPGGQDLTAHVNFTAVEAAGRAAGCDTQIFTTQRRWLTDILATTLVADSASPPWVSDRVRQFQTLTHPDHLGRAFHVLAQRRKA